MKGRKLNDAYRNRRADRRARGGADHLRPVEAARAGQDAGKAVGTLRHYADSNNWDELLEEEEEEKKSGKKQEEKSQKQTENEQEAEPVEEPAEEAEQAEPAEEVEQPEQAKEG